MEGLHNLQNTHVHPYSSSISMEHTFPRVSSLRVGNKKEPIFEISRTIIIHFDVTGDMRQCN